MDLRNSWVTDGASFRLLANSVGFGSQQDPVAQEYLQCLCDRSQVCVYNGLAEWVTVSSTAGSWQKNWCSCE